MTQPQLTTEPTPSTEDFAALLDETFRESDRIEGSVVTGTIIAIDNDEAVVDVGLKAEGRVRSRSSRRRGIRPRCRLGIGSRSMSSASRTARARPCSAATRRARGWNKLEQAFKDNAKVQGMIFGRVKGGFAVDLGGASSCPAARWTSDRCATSPCSTRTSRSRSSRWTGAAAASWCPRAVLEESRAEQRNELLATLKEGQVLSGVVKNITDYGAFVDLGGLDGLHVTDISWRRVNHPSEVLGVGQSVDVQVIRFNRETQRISLGMKQLEADPGRASSSSIRSAPSSPAASPTSPITAPSWSSSRGWKVWSTSPR